VQRLRAQLEEAQSKLERAKSMAQLTRAGFVYVISNVGSFGENVLKVGLTRRLEPLDRVRELGDASVPFPYDVHMMISSDDAPALERALHDDLHRLRVNRVNPRKEFFKVEIGEIARLVEKHHGKVEYVATPEALQYHESLSMSDEDFEYVSGELARFEEDEEGYRPTALDEPPTAQRMTEPPVAIRVTEGSAELPAAGTSAEIGASTDDTEDSPPPAEPSEDRRRVVPCPSCKGGIYADTLVSGGNTCPHCGVSFRVARSR
ncbi:GIY-YIG nuclease family protein, partial [Planctomycetota bacterium]